ncbi:MAG: Ig-like domain-containing protein, partial [Actinobacteria bacterium]|nr:Ig-like domain-containing protein [Actinomycetota bacterium]
TSIVVTTLLFMPSIFAQQPVQVTVPDTSLVASGKSSAQALVTIYRNNIEIGTTQADSQGVFSKIIQPLPTGTSDISLEYEDKQGNASSRYSVNVAFQQQQSTAVEVFLSPTIRLDPSLIFNANQIMTFHGHSIPGAQVTVELNDGAVALQAIANNSGRYLITANPEVVGVGTHTFSVFAEDGSEQSQKSDKHSFIVTRPVPQPTVEQPSLDEPNQTGDDESPEITSPDPPAILSPISGSVVSAQSVQIMGSAQPNAQIELYSDGVVVGSVFSNADGSWSTVFSATRDRHTLYAVACINELCSDSSGEIDLEFSAIRGVCSSDLRLEQYRFWNVDKNDPIPLAISSVRGTSPFTVYIDWGDGRSEQFSIESDKGNEPFLHQYNEPGIYNGIITVADTFNCTASRYFSVHVSDVTATAELTGIAFFSVTEALIGLIVLVGLYFVVRQFLS